MRKIDVEIVFVVLVYRNIDDLQNFIINTKSKVKCNYKIIVIDAKYSDEVSKDIENICFQNKLVYILIDNKGYGYGNNVGIEYANNMYEYKYIIICNPDVEFISTLRIENLCDSEMIIAPQIIANNNKLQNPYWVKENIFSEKLMYIGYKHDIKLFLYVGIFINKIIKYLFRNHNNYIYACHGACIILNYNFIKYYNFKFDDKMFLFYEEALLGLFAKKNNIKIKYDKNIIVRHFEDGSMSISNINEYNFLRDSFIYYYKRYRKL